MYELRFVRDTESIRVTIPKTLATDSKARSARRSLEVALSFINDYATYHTNKITHTRSFLSRHLWQAFEGLPRYTISS